jgi:hypothetical protein
MHNRMQVDNPGSDAGAGTGQQQSGNGNAENVQDVPFEEVIEP